MTQGPWLNRVTGFVLEVISSTHPLFGSSTAGLCSSFQVFFSALPVKWGQGPDFLVGGDMTQLFCLRGLGGLASRNLQIFPNCLTGWEKPGAMLSRI